MDRDARNLRAWQTRSNWIGPALARPVPREGRRPHLGAEVARVLGWTVNLARSVGLAILAGLAVAVGLVVAAHLLRALAEV